MSPKRTTPSATTRNITRYLRSLDPAVIAEGREWYPKARALAEELAASTFANAEQVKTKHYPIWEAEVAKAAAVIAVLSPRLNWTKNVELAKLAYARFAELPYGNRYPFDVEELVDGWPGLKDGARKAFRILASEDPNEVVSGPKVRSFWFTIVDPTDPRAVVVDRHAIDIACGRVLTDVERGRLVSTPGKYDELSELYRRAARILSRELGQSGQLRRHAPDGQWGITPAEVQAITWTAWRREHAANAKANRTAEMSRPKGPWSWDGAPNRTAETGV